MTPDNDKLSEAIEAVEFAQPHTADSSLGIVLGAAWQVLAARSAPSAVLAAAEAFDVEICENECLKPGVKCICIEAALAAAALHSQPQEPDALRGALEGELVKALDELARLIPQHEEKCREIVSDALRKWRLSSHATESASLRQGAERGVTPTTNRGNNK
jgi:hypothetical protein